MEDDEKERWCHASPPPPPTTTRPHTNTRTHTQTRENALIQVTGTAAQEITYSSRDTSSGRYRSLTIQCPVQNADQLYAIYDRISQDARVKFKF